MMQLGVGTLSQVILMGKELLLPILSPLPVLTDSLLWKFLANIFIHFSQKLSVAARNKTEDG